MIFQQFIARVNTMKILELTEQLRSRVNAHGNMVVLAENSGVTYSWLTKFADGRITNPTVANLNKLENFFNLSRQDAA